MQYNSKYNGLKWQRKPICKLKYIEYNWEMCNDKPTFGSNEYW